MTAILLYILTNPALLAMFLGFQTLELYIAKREEQQKFKWDKHGKLK